MTGDGPDGRCCRLSLQIGFLSWSLEGSGGYSELFRVDVVPSSMDMRRSVLHEAAWRTLVFDACLHCLFHCTPLIALRSIMTFGLSLVMIRTESADEQCYVPCSHVQLRAGQGEHREDLQRPDEALARAGR